MNMHIQHRRFSFAALAFFFISACGPSIELVDDGLIAVQGTLPLDVTALSSEARSRLAVSAEVPGLVGETTLQVTDDGSFTGSLGFNIEADQSAELLVRVRGALHQDSEQVLLARASLPLQLVARDQVDATVTDFDVAAANEGVNVFDRNRNGTSNLDDLLNACDPGIPPLSVHLSATDLQFPSGTVPGHVSRRVLVVGNNASGRISTSINVEGSAPSPMRFPSLGSCDSALPFLMRKTAVA